MKNNRPNLALQVHLDQFFSKLAQCPELEGQLSPEDLPELLQACLSHVLNTALSKERQFHLEDPPQDRGNRYPPTRTHKLGTTRVQFERPRTPYRFYTAVVPN